MNKRQLDGLGPKGEGGLPTCGPPDKASTAHSKAGKGREREPDVKNGHNLFMAAAAAPPAGLLSGPGLAPAASSAGGTAPSVQTHRPFLGAFAPGPQFALGPMSLQANLGPSVLQSLFSSVPAAGLVHVSTAATRLTNSHAMGSFSSGVAGGAVGGRQGPRGHLVPQDPLGDELRATRCLRRPPGLLGLTAAVCRFPSRAP